MRAICIDSRPAGSAESSVPAVSIPAAEVVTVASVAAARALIADGQGCALVVAAGPLPAEERTRFTGELSRMTPPVPLVVLGEVAGEPGPGEARSELHRLRTTIENLPYCFQEIDRGGRLMSMNAAGLSMLGIASESEVVGSSVLDVMYAEERDRVAPLLQGALAGTSARFGFTAPDGRGFFSNLIPIAGEDGDVERVIAFTLDVSGRTRRMETLRRQRDFSTALVESAPVIILLLDENGRIDYVNPYFDELTGYQLGEVAGKVWFETFLPERDRDQVRQLFSKAVDGVPTRGNVNAIVTRDGQERLVEWYDRTLPGDDGGPSRLLAIGQDVTARKQAEEALSASEERLRSILDGMFAYIALYSPDGVMLEVNRHTLEQWSLPREQMVGRKPWETERWANAPRAREALQSAYERAGRGETIRSDMTARLTDGRVVTTDSTLQPLFDSQGKVTGVLSFAVDVSERARAEAKLRESEIRLREAQRIAGIGNWELDLVSGELHWSDEIFRIFEIDKEEFGASYGAFLEAIHPDDRMAVDLAYTRSLETREPYDISHRLRMADGRIKHVEERCESFWDEEGRPLRSVGTVQDVTERENAHAALRASEAKIRATLDAIPDLLFDVDIEGRYHDFHSPRVELLAAPPEDLIGKVISEVLPADVAAVVMGALHEANERGRSAGQQFFLDLPHGRSWFELSVSSKETPVGDQPRFVVLSRDISERKRAEEALHLDHAAIESSINAMAMAGLDGNLVYINGSFLDLWGLNSVEDALGRPASAFWPDPNGTAMRALQSEGHWVGELEVGRSDGTVFTAMASEHLVLDRYGNPVRLMASFVDISMTKAAEAALLAMNVTLEERVEERTAQLKTANQELETFTYSVSHDLKAPLRSIDGYSRLLLDDYAGKLDEEGAQFLANVRQAAVQMGRLIDDLLAYTRLERRAVTSDPVDVQGLVEALWSEQLAASGVAGVPININISCDAMAADRDALTLVLRNLLENAAKFMGDNPQPSIEVGSSSDESRCLLWVRDNGIGFDMKFHGRIFDIFQRLHRAEEYPGTGIGLAIVRKAAERMGGRVWAESQPGEGATFFLEVPK